MKKIAIIIMSTITVVITAFTSACNQDQPIMQQATLSDSEKGLEAFNTIVRTYPDQKGYHKVLQHWNFTLPGGELFEWSKDTSANPADYAIVLLSDPLVEAGLDLTLLDASKWLVKPAEVEDGKQLPNRLIRPYNISDKKETSDGSEDALRRLFKQKPEIVAVDTARSMIRLVLDDGIEVRWAENLAQSESDFEFVFDAAPFVEAGLDLKKVAQLGWLVRGDGQDAPSTSANTIELVKEFALD